MSTTIPWRSWLLLGALSLLLFLITASTFSSLGVVLPAMIKENGWSFFGRLPGLHPAGRVLRGVVQAAGHPDPQDRGARRHHGRFGGDGGGLRLPGASPGLAGLSGSARPCWAWAIR
jgi:hypothetical protein